MNKKYNDIDDLFRDKFEDFEVEPPEYVWENVRTRMGGSNGGGSGLTRGGIAGITFLIVAIGVVGFLFMDLNPLSSKGTPGASIDGAMVSVPLLADNQPEPEVLAAAVQGESQITREDEADEGDGKKDKKEEAKKERKNRVKGTNPKKNATVFIRPSVDGAVSPARMAITPLSADPRPAMPIEVGAQEAGILTLQQPAAHGEEELKNDAVTEVASTRGDSPSMLRGDYGQVETNGSNRNAKTGGNRTGSWELGLYFTPELITYPSDDQLKNYSYSVDLLASRKLGDYFLQSGLGVSRNQDQGNSLIDYNKYLGSYEDVYDVTFDTTGNEVVPVYHTETVNVYDSVSHVVISPTKRSFTYLQVPLLVGYGEQSRRLGWFVKGGPSLSFLIHEKIPATGMPENRARVLNVENELPGRISTHWQFIVSAGVTYKLGSRMHLSMEPMFRYYIKSVYEQEKLNTRHPFSVGLRTGLLLSF